MSNSRFLAINPDVSIADDDGSIEYYGESELSVFDALKQFRSAEINDVANALMIQPSETVAVEVWTTKDSSDEAFDDVLDSLVGTFHLPWEG